MIRATLQRFDVTFDVWQSERALHEAGDVNETLRALDAAGYIDRHDDAVWLKTTALWGDDKDRVVVKSDGLPTYLLADIAYHRKKLARGFQELCDIWGADHHGHIARMRAALKAFGHLARRAARDPDPDGEPAAQRPGGEDGQAGRGVRHPRRRRRRGGARRHPLLLPDAPARHAAGVRSGAGQAQSMDNPVYYVQYAHARCCAILRRARELGAPDHAAGARADGAPGAGGGDRDPEAPG